MLTFMEIKKAMCERNPSHSIATKTTFLKRFHRHLLIDVQFAKSSGCPNFPIVFGDDVIVSSHV